MQPQEPLVVFKLTPDMNPSITSQNIEQLLHAAPTI